jgi:hypothetical protein
LSKPCFKPTHYPRGIALDHHFGQSLRHAAIIRAWATIHVRMNSTSFPRPSGTVPRHFASAHRRSGNAVFVLALAALAASCGGGGGSSGSPGNGNGGGEPVFPMRGGGESPEPPPSVQTARIAFDSDTGERCCVALPAAAIPGGALLVLDDLPAGPATVLVAFFAEDFAPSVPGTDATCRTVPVELGQPCDPTRVASPSFESDLQSVEIVAGGQTNVADLVIHALPFIFDFAPGDGETVEDPVAFAFTVADPVTDVEEESVVLELTLQEPVGSSFRPLTKRVALQLSACSDGTEEPCSLEGDREVVGFHAQSDATMLLPGPVDVHIMAINQGEPPQEVDFAYEFEVVPAEGAALEFIDSDDDLELIGSDDELEFVGSDEAEVESLE